MSNSNRIIALIDCDCFYATVESIRLNIPFSVPLAVQQWKMLIAVNYEARKYGILRGDTIQDALKKCPNLKLVHVETNITNTDAIIQKTNDGIEIHDPKNEKVSLERYRVANIKIMNIFSRFVNAIERASVDEAYFDLTDIVNKKIEELKSQAVRSANAFEIKGIIYGGDCVIEESQLFSKDDINLRICIGSQIVETIRSTIESELGYTCSAGISTNKVFAKIAAGINKPNKQTVLFPNYFPLLLQSIPLKKFRGLGGLLGQQIKERNITFANELIAKYDTEMKLQDEFGPKNGTFLWQLSHGINHEEVKDRNTVQSITSHKQFIKIPSVKSPEFDKVLTLLCDEVTSRYELDCKQNNRKPSIFNVNWCNAESTRRSKQFEFVKIEFMHGTLLSYFKSTPEAFPLSAIGVNLFKMVDIGPEVNCQSITSFFSKSTKADSAPNQPFIPPSDEESEIICLDDEFGDSKTTSSCAEETICLDDDCIIIEDKSSKFTHKILKTCPKPISSNQSTKKAKLDHYFKKSN